MPETRLSVSQPRTLFISCVVMSLVALAACLALPLWPNRESLLDMGKIVGYSTGAFLMWFLGLIAWGVSLWRLCRYCHMRTWQQTRDVLIPALVVIYAAFVAMYPASAIDVFIYAARSRLFSEYGENPNGSMPITYWDTDPYMHFASKEWADDFSPYGPLWNIIAYPVTAIGGDSIGIALIGFKLLSMISALAIGWFVYDTVKRVRPGWELPAALFWLLNPLLLWDGIGNAHNDVTVMLPVVIAIWAWHRKLDRWVIPVILASVLIKYVTIILLPIAVIAVWKRNPEWRERIAGVLLGLGCGMLLLAVSLFPFHDFNAVRESASAQGAKVAVSPAWAIKSTLAEWDLAIVTNEAVLNIAYVIVSIYIAFWMIACWRVPERLPRAMFEVMFAFMLIASTNQRPWYVIWILPLAAVLIPESVWRRAGLWSVTAMLQHACTIWLWSVWNFERDGYYGYALTIVGVVFGPVILLSLWEVGTAAQEWHSRRNSREVAVNARR